MARVTVVHNPTAGDDAPDEATLRSLLVQAGYRPELHATGGMTWKDALDDPGDLVVAAGGDGTIAKVARRLAGRGVPMAILPAGTANNIARTLDLCRDPRTLIGEWARARATPVDVGVVRGPAGERIFIESAGVGLFPRLMLEGERTLDSADIPGREQIGRAVALLRSLAQRVDAAHCTIVADGVTLADSYLAVEVMNIRALGPRIRLAPHADPHDGLLDVITIREVDRRTLRRILDEGTPGEVIVAPFTCTRAREVEISWEDWPAHVDDDLWPEIVGDEEPASRAGPASMRVTIQPGALEVLLCGPSPPRAVR